MYEGQYEQSNVIQHLSELGGWLQHLDLHSSCEEDDEELDKHLSEEEKQTKYGCMFISASEAVAKFDQWQKEQALLDKSGKKPLQ